MNIIETLISFSYIVAGFTARTFADCGAAICRTATGTTMVRWTIMDVTTTEEVDGEVADFAGTLGWTVRQQQEIRTGDTVVLPYTGQVCEVISLDGTFARIWSESGTTGLDITPGAPVLVLHRG